MQPVVLVAFLSDSCPHCTHFKPVLQGLAQAGIPIIEQNAQRDRQAVQQWGVTGFPATFICRSEPEGLRVLGRVDGAAAADAMVNTVRAAAADEVGQVKPHLVQSPQQPNANTTQGYPGHTGRLPMQVPPMHAMPPGTGHPYGM